MKVINASYELLLDLTYEEALAKIERMSRTCYQSENRIKPDSAENHVRKLIAREHEAMIEHISLSVKFITQRSFSHELVRHRIGTSFAQESQRYCSYDPEGNQQGEVVFVKPPNFKEDTSQYVSWYYACQNAEQNYFDLRRKNTSPQEAREVLPNSTKTEIWITANLRAWRHILKLRALGTTGKPDPRMLELMVPLLKELQTVYPVFFEDLVLSP